MVSFVFNDDGDADDLDDDHDSDDRDSDDSDDHDNDDPDDHGDHDDDPDADDHDLSSFFFHDHKGRWPDRTIRRKIGWFASRYFKYRCGVMAWRHIAIAVERHIVHSGACKVLGVDHQTGNNDDDEADAGGDVLYQASHHQAAHSISVGEGRYGNSQFRQAGITDRGLRAFGDVSEAWHRFLGLDSSEPSRKRAASSLPIAPAAKHMAALGSLQSRRQLWTMPAVDAAVKQLLGPEARVRPAQAEALTSILQWLGEVVVVLPTGGGKTLLYVLPTLLPGAQVTVVIAPLVALKNDLVRRCEEWGVGFSSQLTKERLGALANLVLVDVEQATSADGLASLSQLFAADRLDRIVLDEAHLVLNAADYRDQVTRLRFLRAIPVPFICLTGTLPVSFYPELKIALGMTRPQLIRSSSDRPNLQFSIKRVLGPNLKEVALDVIISELGSLASGAAIVYVRTRADGKAIAEELQCPFYHAKLERSERQRALGEWTSVMVATTAFGAGIDRKDVRLVIHVDAPDGTVEWAQMAGRAGRDGGPARCLIVARSTRGAWLQRATTDFGAMDAAHMEKMIVGSECIRKAMTEYLDGKPIRCLETDGVVRQACNRCERPVAARLVLEESPVVGSPAASSPGLPAVGRRHLGQASSDGGEDESEPSNWRGAGGVRAGGDAGDAGEEDNDDDDGDEDDDNDGDEDDDNDEDDNDDGDEKDGDGGAGLAAAAEGTRLEVIAKEDYRNRFAALVAEWGTRCVPCSWVSRSVVLLQHGGCVRANCEAAGMKSLIGKWRRSINIEREAQMCWRCWTPRWFCGKKLSECNRANVMVPTLAAAWRFESGYSRQILAALHGPAIAEFRGEDVPAALFRWMGGAYPELGVFDRMAKLSVFGMHMLLRLERLVAVGPGEGN